jgi:hypothetical protein
MTSKASEAPLFEIGIRPNTVMISYSMQPPHLAMIAHGKLPSQHLSQIQPPTPEHYNRSVYTASLRLIVYPAHLLRVPLRCSV